MSLPTTAGLIVTLWIPGHQTLPGTCWPRHTCHKQQSTQGLFLLVRTISSTCGGPEAKPSLGSPNTSRHRAARACPSLHMHICEEKQEVLPSNSSKRLGKHSASAALLSPVAPRVSLAPVGRMQWKAIAQLFPSPSVQPRTHMTGRAPALLP